MGIFHVLTFSSLAIIISFAPNMDKADAIFGIYAKIIWCGCWFVLGGSAYLIGKD